VLTDVDPSRKSLSSINVVQIAAALARLMRDQ